MKNLVKHFVTTAYLVNNDKVALVHHGLRNVWLGFGGHIEEKETILEALDREIKEESGIRDYKLLNDGGLIKSFRAGDEGPDKPDETVREETLPNSIQIQPIPFDRNYKNPHYHIDLIYYGTTDQTDLSLEEGKGKDVKWVSVQDLEQIDLWPSTKYLCKEALKAAKGSKHE